MRDPGFSRPDERALAARPGQEDLPMSPTCWLAIGPVAAEIPKAVVSSVSAVCQDGLGLTPLTRTG